MIRSGVLRRDCSLCGEMKVWLGDEFSAQIRLRVCPKCDSPELELPCWHKRAKL